MGHNNLQNDVTTATSSSSSSSIVDEDDSLDKIDGSCSSSSSLCSYSNHFEVDIGEEYHTQFLESPSMISTMPQACDLNALYESPKQSPPIQVMGQHTGYDMNQVASSSSSSMYGPKHRSNSDWSLASSESLFSIHTGNNSFSMDGGFFISRSGEFNWIDDHSCSTPDATKSSSSMSPTVIDTSAENERKSASTNSESGDSETEKGKSFANPANISRRSDASCQSTNSFAFPVLAGGGGSPSPTKLEADKPQPTPPPAETTPKASPTIPKAGGNQWFHCFSCFPMCC